MRYYILVALIFLLVFCSKENPVEEIQNNPPEINNMAALPDSVGFNESLMIFCCASDPDKEILTYEWNSKEGTIWGGDSVITWNAPENECQPWIVCTVTDPQGALDKDSVQVFVIITSP